MANIRTGHSGESRNPASFSRNLILRHWIPAFAGMTAAGECGVHHYLISAVIPPPPQFFTLRRLRGVRKFAAALRRVQIPAFAGMEK